MRSPEDRETQNCFTLVIDRCRIHHSCWFSIWSIWSTCIKYINVVLKGYRYCISKSRLNSNKKCLPIITGCMSSLTLRLAPLSPTHSSRTWLPAFLTVWSHESHCTVVFSWHSLTLSVCTTTLLNGWMNISHKLWRKGCVWECFGGSHC